jgi:hypothetical protein
MSYVVIEKEIEDVIKSLEDKQLGNVFSKFIERNLDRWYSPKNVNTPLFPIYELRELASSYEALLDAVKENIRYQNRKLIEWDQVPVFSAEQQKKEELENLINNPQQNTAYKYFNYIKALYNFNLLEVYFKGQKLPINNKEWIDDYRNLIEHPEEYFDNKKFRNEYFSVSGYMKVEFFHFPGKDKIIDLKNFCDENTFQYKPSLEDASKETINDELHYILKTNKIRTKNSNDIQKKLFTIMHRIVVPVPMQNIYEYSKKLTNTWDKMILKS